MPKAEILFNKRNNRDGLLLMLSFVYLVQKTIGTVLKSTVLSLLVFLKNIFEKLIYFIF